MAISHTNAVDGLAYTSTTGAGCGPLQHFGPTGFTSPRPIVISNGREKSHLDRIRTFAQHRGGVTQRFLTLRRRALNHNFSFRS